MLKLWSKAVPLLSLVLLVLFGLSPTAAVSHRLDINTPHINLVDVGSNGDTAGKIAGDSQKQKTDCMKRCATSCPPSSCMSGLSAGFASWHAPALNVIRVAILTVQTDYTTFREPPVRPPIG